MKLAIDNFPRPFFIGNIKIEVVYNPMDDDVSIFANLGNTTVYETAGRYTSDEKFKEILRKLVDRVKEPLRVNCEIIDL